MLVQLPFWAWTDKMQIHVCFLRKLYHTQHVPHMTTRIPRKRNEHIRHGMECHQPWWEEWTDGFGRNPQPPTLHRTYPRKYASLGDGCFRTKFCVCPGRCHAPHSAWHDRFSRTAECRVASGIHHISRVLCMFAHVLCCVLFCLYSSGMLC